MSLFSEQVLLTHVFYSGTLHCFPFSFRSGVFQKDAYDGRQMRFGVREHGMSSVMNGMFAYGGIRPFGATFLNFITYAWGGVRLR